MAETCDYQGCENPAEYLDDTDNEVCGPCMYREIEDGADPDGFESIKSVQEAFVNEKLCEIPGCKNDGEYHGLNMRFCDEHYQTEVPECSACNAGKLIDDADRGGCKCNTCGHVEEYKAERRG